MSDITPYTPDYLTEALAAEVETGSTDLFISDDNQMPKLPRIEIPQRTSMKHAGQMGKIYISGAASEDEGEYVDHIDFLLLSPLVFDREDRPDWMLQEPLLKSILSDNRNPGVGSRTMWTFDPEGKRTTDAQSPVCASNNGIEPWPNYRDISHFDYRTKSEHRIGWTTDENGQSVRRANACLGCPFAQWITVDDGVDEKGQPKQRKYAPMCRETFTYVLWDVDRSKLLTLKAVNMGMQLALWGYKGANGRRYDGGIFPGIRDYFAHRANKTYKLTNGKTVPTFANRPEGKPSPDNPNAPVYVVRMTAFLNNFSPPTFVPQFTILDGSTDIIPQVSFKKKDPEVVALPLGEDKVRQLSAEQYVAYLKAQRQFIEEDYRNKLMAMNLVSIPGQTPALPELPPMSNNPQLPATATPPTAATFDAPFDFDK